MLSATLPAIDVADLSDAPPSEATAPKNWPGHLVPNLSDWQPGDILLVARDDGKLGLGIEVAQRLSAAAAVRRAAAFTHAAIYLGDGQLVDATPIDGVAQRSVWFYCQRRTVALRRLNAPSGVVGWGAAISATALRHVGEEYSLLAAIQSKLLPTAEPDPLRLYCSTFVGLVLAEATGVLLWTRREHRPLHPATLASHPDLHEVPLEWRPLAVR